MFIKNVFKLMELVLYCLIMESCTGHIDLNKYNIATEAVVDTFMIEKSGMRVVYCYEVDGIEYKTSLVMNPAKKIPKGFPILVRYSSDDPEKNIIITDSIVVFNGLRINYVYKTYGGFTYELYRN